MIDANYAGLVLCFMVIGSLAGWFGVDLLVRKMRSANDEEERTKPLSEWQRRATERGWCWLIDGKDRSVNFLKSADIRQTLAEYLNAEKQSTNRTVHASVFSPLVVSALSHRDWRRLTSTQLPMFEARGVYRQGKALKGATSDHYSVYLSSQSGCEMGCSFCFLTVNGSTGRRYATLDDYAEQFELTMLYWRHTWAADHGSVRKVYVNLMARGDALNNPVIQRDYKRFHDRLREIALKYGFTEMRINLSTIFPDKSVHHLTHEGKWSTNVLADWWRSPSTDRRPVHFYWSLYSTDSTKRIPWMPHAIEPTAAFDAFAEFQRVSGLPVTIHGTMIADFNDDRSCIDDMAAEIRRTGLRGKVNIIGFNPHPRLDGVQREAEPEIRQYALETLRQAFLDTSAGTFDEREACKSKIHARVGQSVCASCGTFPMAELF